MVGSVVGTGQPPHDEAPARVEALGKQNDGDAGAKSEGVAALRPLYAILRRRRKEARP
jgi:hypothetical protein